MSRCSTKSLVWGNQSSKRSSQQLASLHSEFLLRPITLPIQFPQGTGLGNVLPAFGLSASEQFRPG